MKNKGFSLVELIVVIAIMAILVGVAVPVYTSYIEKSQKAKDEQMIDEIKHALQIASAGQSFDVGEGGYIILSTEGVSGVEADSNLDKVLKQTFGDNYADTLKLSYGEWGNNALYLGLIDGSAESVYNSTYYGVSDQLMGQVEDITDAAMAILEMTSTNDPRTDMINMFRDEENDAEGTSAFLNEVAMVYGYVNEDGNGDLSQVKTEELANFLVLAVAYDVSNASYIDNYQVFPATGLIQNFALYNGYAATEQGKADGFDVAYNQFVADLNTADGIPAIAEAYKELRAASGSASGYNAYVSGQGQTDSDAFAAMMNGLSSATAGGNAAAVKADLANENFFTSGLGNGLFATYVDSVESFLGLDFADEEMVQEFLNAMGQDGVVGIFFTNSGNAIVINDSLPVR